MEFWALSWHDVTIYLAALHEQAEEKKSEREFHIERTRQFMALFANANKGKNQRTFMPQDFWKLSYDKESAGEAPQSLEEFERIVAKYNRKRSKK